MAQPKVMSPLLDDRLIAHNVLVAGSTILAGVLGFAFQVVVSHRLRPSDYAAVFAAMTFLTLIALPASALTLLMARETSRGYAAGHAAASATLLRSGNQVLVAGGIVVGLCLAVASHWLGGFLGVPAMFVVAIAASMPLTFALPLLLGELQGQQRFLPFSLLNVGMALAKLAAAIVLGIALGPLGVILGLAIASAMSYAVAFILLRRKLAIRVSMPWLRSAAGYLALVVPSTLAISVLLSADVLLVKHFFNDRAAGEYSAVAALGRAIFWGGAGVAAVLFPKVSFHESQGASGSRIVGVSLALVAGGGIAGFAFLTLLAKAVLTAFAGSPYAAGASILPLYAIAMTLLGGASVLIATHQSRARGAFLSVLLPVTVAEPILILAFHSSLMQVVSVVTLAMAVLVAGLAVLLVRRPAGRFSDDVLTGGAIAEAQA